MSSRNSSGGESKRQKNDKRAARFGMTVVDDDEEMAEEGSDEERDDVDVAAEDAGEEDVEGAHNDTSWDSDGGGGEDVTGVDVGCDGEMSTHAASSDEAAELASVHSLLEEDPADCESNELKQYVALMTPWGNDGYPPIMTRHSDSSLTSATFALPAFRASTKGGDGVRVTKSSLDLNKFSMPSVMLVRKEDNSATYLWSCNCTALNVCHLRNVQTLHTFAGGCSDVVSVDCPCVRYCRLIVERSASHISSPEREVEITKLVTEIIEFSPVHEPVEAGNDLV
jgi:hypothetical protein